MGPAIRRKIKIENAGVDFVRPLVGEKQGAAIAATDAGNAGAPFFLVT